MRKRIAFDVDMTLIDEEGQPIVNNVVLLKQLSHYADIFVWSGGGTDYVIRRLKEIESWVEGIDITVIPKTLDEGRKYGIDISFDDQEVSLGKVNIQV